MIISALLTPIFGIINMLISLLPKIGDLPTWISDTTYVIGLGLNLFPTDVWIFALGSIIFWRFALIAWACVEWIYKKIPGVD